jgi:hypothetical protein
VSQYGQNACRSSIDSSGIIIFSTFYFVRYFKDSNNIVHLKGRLIERSNFPPEGTMFTLPEGWKSFQNLLDLTWTLKDASQNTENNQWAEKEFVFK